MKVILFSHWYFEYTIELANALSKSTELYLFLPFEAKKYDKYIGKNVIKKYFKKPRLRSLNNIGSTRKLCTEFRKIDPDIIHFQDNYIWLALNQSLTKYNLVTTQHDPILHMGEEKIRDELTNYLMRKKSSESLSGKPSIGLRWTRRPARIPAGKL